MIGTSIRLSLTCHPCFAFRAHGATARPLSNAPLGCIYLTGE